MELDPIESCPYDKSHRIRRSRMQWHTTRCSNNHQHANMKRCHYDASHVVSQSQFEEHLLNCPSRELSVKPSASGGDIKDASNILPVNTQNADADDWGPGEWTEESNFQSYEPLKAIEDRPIVHAKVGLSKAQRKEHRMEERKRFNKVMQQNTKR